MYTSASKSVYSRLTLLLQHLVHSFTVCLAAQKCGNCLLTLYIQLSNPTKCNLHNINLLFSILKAMTLIQVPVTSCIDYCFISYFVHIQSVFYTINTVMRLFCYFYLKIFNYTSTEQIPYYDRFFMFWFFPTIKVSFLILLLFSFYTAAIFNCFQFPGMFHEHIQLSLAWYAYWPREHYVFFIYLFLFHF